MRILSGKIKFYIKKVLSLIKKKLHLYKPQNWREIEHFDKAWKKRIACMAQLIDKQSKSVVDLGCGQCWLKDILPTDVKYTGVDYKPRECANNIVCDFNGGEFPDVAADVVFCSGILEYIEDLPAFINNICAITNQVILSYCSIDFSHNDLEIRESLGWKNHLSSTDMIGLFLKNDFSVVRINQEIPGNIILKLKKN